MEYFEQILAFLESNSSWLGVSIFIIAFLECLALVGLIMPGVVMMFAVAALAGKTNMPLWQAILWAWSGGLLGDLLSYTLGYKLKNGVTKLPLLRNHPQWLHQAEVYFNRFGMISLLVGRFIGPLRPLLPMTAGMLRMNKFSFALISIFAALGWAIGYTAPAWLVGHALDTPVPEDFWWQFAWIAGGISLVAGCGIWGTWRQRQWLHLSIMLSSLVLLISLLLGWSHLTSFDLHIQHLTQVARSIELDKLTVVITRIADVKTQVTVIAVLCALLAYFKLYRSLAFSIGTVGMAVTCNTALKYIVMRPRPEILNEPLSGYSMPSGHTSASFAFFLTIGVLLSRGQIPRGRMATLACAIIPAICVGMSRIYLGAHWPTDVVAGAMVGCFSCALMLRLSEKYPLEVIPRKQLLSLAGVGLLTFITLISWNLESALALYHY